MDTLIKDFGHFALWQVSNENINEFAMFVANINYKSHKGGIAPKCEMDAIVYKEQSIYNLSRLFAVKDKNGKYLGTIRTTRWDRKTILPMHEKFGINVSKVLQDRDLDPFEVWHVGRLAVDNVSDRHANYSLNNRAQILRVLLTQAIMPICSDRSNVLLAECDDRFLKMAPQLNLVNSELLGKPVHYLGSPAVPVMNTATNLEYFINQNKQYCCA